MYYFLSYAFISTLPRICLNCPSLAYLCFVQMAAPALMVFDEDGRAHSECIHWEGFPSILWGMMRDAGYPSPPRYMGEEFHEMGVARCRVRLTHAPQPIPALWSSVELEVVGHRLLDTWELAAMRALTRFCSLHLEAITVAPIGIFPAEQPNDPNWHSHVSHLGFLQRHALAETITMMVRCMNALYRWQVLQGRALSQVIGTAQNEHEIGRAKDEQMADLNA